MRLKIISDQKMHEIINDEINRIETLYALTIRDKHFMILALDNIQQAINDVIENN